LRTSGPPRSPTRLLLSAAAAAGNDYVAAAAGYDPVSSQPARLYPTATAAAGYGPAVSDILEKFEDVLNPSQRLPDTAHGVLQHRRT